MMLTKLATLMFSSSKAAIPTIPNIRQKWGEFSHLYNSFDVSPQTFYYTFSTMLRLEQATNILEVGCGTGKLLQLGLHRKAPSANYLASDLSSQMIGLAQQNLRSYFDRYESKLTFEEWCNRQRLSFRVQNAEQHIQNGLFDRIICNNCLMLTQDPRKMLKNLYSVAAEGCLFAVNVWGEKTRNNMMMAIRDSIIDSGYELPAERSNFHLFNKVAGLATETGWEVMVQWEQLAPFPAADFDWERDQAFLGHQVRKLPEEQQPAVSRHLHDKIKKIFEEKKPLTFATQNFILRKNKT